MPKPTVKQRIIGGSKWVAHRAEEKVEDWREQRRENKQFDRDIKLKAKAAERAGYERGKIERARSRGYHRGKGSKGKAGTSGLWGTLAAINSMDNPFVNSVLLPGMRETKKPLEETGKTTIKVNGTTITIGGQKKKKKRSQSNTALDMLF